MAEYLPKRRRVGGLRVDPRKADSTSRSIAADFVPAELLVPVDGYPGPPPDVVVLPGQSVLRGEPVAVGKPGSGVADVHASSSGTVREICSIDIYGAAGKRPLQCVVIDTDRRDARFEPAAERTATDDARAAQIEKIRAAGIVGLGGAAVSTSWKLTRRERVPTLIVNGAECEPYISCDDMLMREYASEILAGSLALCELLGAERCIVAIERDKPEALAAMRAAAEQLDDRRLFLAELPRIYPAGGERQLVELLLDAEVPTGQFPADIGVVCQNVGTAYAVQRAVSADEPLIRRVVTLSGRGIAQPRNVFARIGTRLGDLIEHFGGYAANPAAVIVGGSMMGIAQQSDAIPVSRSTNCVLVPAPDEFGPIAGMPLQQWPCIRCGECAAVCPARLMPQELLRAADDRNAARLTALGLRDCIECGCCDAICPSHITLTQRFVDAKRLLSRREATQAFTAQAQDRFDARARRLSDEHDAEEQAQKALRERLSSAEEKKRYIAAAVKRAGRHSSDDER